MDTTLHYRKDIDGLRALAVILVVLYILRPGSDARSELERVGSFDEKTSSERFQCVLQAKSWEALDQCKPGVTAVPGRKRVLVWGDSHAPAIGASIKRASAELGYIPTTLPVLGCPPVFGVHRVENGKSSKTCNEARCGRFYADSKPQRALSRVTRKLASC